MSCNIMASNRIDRENRMVICQNLPQFGKFPCLLFCTDDDDCESWGNLLIIHKALVVYTVGKGGEFQLL